MPQLVLPEDDGDIGGDDTAGIGGDEMGEMVG